MGEVIRLLLYSSEVYQADARQKPKETRYHVIKMTSAALDDKAVSEKGGLDTSIYKDYRTERMDHGERSIACRWNLVQNNITRKNTIFIHFVTSSSYLGNGRRQTPKTILPARPPLDKEDIQRPKPTERLTLNPPSASRNMEGECLIPNHKTLASAGIQGKTPRGKGYYYVGEFERRK